jgi:hypothetical protein
MSEYKPGGMTPEQDEAFRKQMYAGGVPPPRKPNPPSQGPDPEAKARRLHRFGMAVLAVAILVMLIYFALPDDDRRGPFIAFSIALALAGGIFVDRANRLTKNGRRRHEQEAKE